MINSVQGAISKANQFKRQGELQQASSMYQKAHELDPTNVSVMKLYSSSLNDIQLFSLASKVSAGMVQRQPTNIMFLDFHAINLRNAGSPHQAIQYHQKALNIDKNNVQCLFELAQDYEALSQLQKAELTLDKAIEIQQNNIIFLKYKQKLEKLQGKDTNQTIKKLIKIDKKTRRQYIIEKLKQEPSNAMYHDQLAKCYYNEGQYDKCIEQQKKAMELQPNHIDYKQNLAIHLLNIKMRS